jgi:uncharacterized membrane protein YgcG
MLAAMKLHSLVLGAGLALGFLTSASAALANGRYPTAGQIAIDPADPAHIVIRATYGIVTTSDGGAHWSWICENALGYNGFEDPMMAITKDGSVLAGLFVGLNVTHDRGCQWDLAGQGLEKRYVVDLSTERADPAKSVLIISNGMGKDVFLTQLWESSDNAKTWTQAGVNLSSSFLARTVDSAPSDPSRIYVSGRFGSPEYTGALQRSKDRGKTWESLPIPNSNDLNLPYIAAIDPKDPNIVYVRLDGDPKDSLQISKNGGDTWTEALVTPESLLGFALSPDGATIAIGTDVPGTDKSGLWTAPTSTLAFTKVSALSIRCLTWTEQGLFACTDQYRDGFAAGLSTDGGKTFSPLLNLQTLCGPLACDGATSTGKVCPDLWGLTQITIQACKGDAGPGGGSGNGSGNGSGSSGSASSGSASGGSGQSSGGCSCSAPGEARASVLGGLFALALSVLLGSRMKRS